jgi:hypothetical protein
MATTTNYGWTTPDDTDLVKNGADAIRTLGSSIDTSMNTALGTKKAGLVLLNTTSLSAVASQSINNVFNATYNNYKIIATGLTSSADGIYIRLRASGSDNSTANSYVRQTFNANATTLAGSRLTSNSWELGVWDTTLVNAVVIDLFNPFAASATGFLLDLLRSTSSAYLQVATGTHNQTVSYDGFTFYPGAGTITGSVSVYGYNK